MREKAEELEKIINSFHNNYKNLDESLTVVKLSSDKWSLKEIIGHLIDSASNNHQRFIRMQLEDNISYPDYKRDEWLGLQDHNNMKFNDLLCLFVYFNRLMEKIIMNVKPESLQHRWIVNWDENSKFITLEKLIIHYVNHIKGHIIDFKERLDEIMAGME